MKTNSLLLALALMATVLLNSCIVPEPGYGGGYGGGYDDGYSGSYGSTYGSSYGGGYAQPSYGYGGGAIGSSYGSGYGRNYCSVCRSYTCSGHHNNYSRTVVQRDTHDHDHDHDRPRSSSNNSKKDDDEPKYRHLSGGAHGGASGTHTKEWFTDRGYAPSRLKKVN